MSERVPTAGSARTRETLAELYVVDADVHVHEDVAELAEHAEPPWDVALREIAKVEERYLDLPAMSPRAEFRIPWPGGSNRPQVVGSPAVMRRELDDLQVVARRVKWSRGEWIRAARQMGLFTVDTASKPCYGRVVRSSLGRKGGFSWISKTSGASQAAWMPTRSVISFSTADGS